MTHPRLEEVAQSTCKGCEVRHPFNGVAEEIGEARSGDHLAIKWNPQKNDYNSDRFQEGNLILTCLTNSTGGKRGRSQGSGYRRITDEEFSSYIEIFQLVKPIIEEVLRERKAKRRVPAVRSVNRAYAEILLKINREMMKYPFNMKDFNGRFGVDVGRTRKLKRPIYEIKDCFSIKIDEVIEIIKIELKRRKLDI